MTKASQSKKPAKPAKKPAAKAAASKSAPAKKGKIAAKPVKPVKHAAKPVAKAAAKAPVKAAAKPVKIEKPVKAAVKTPAKPAPKEDTKPKAEAKKPAKAAAVETRKDSKASVPTPAPKPGSKIAPKKPGENETPGDADSPLLDMSDVGVRKMIAKAKARGYVTYDELNKVLPSDKTSSEQIEDTMAMLNEMGINVIESEEAEEGEEGGSCPSPPKAPRRWPPPPKAGEQYDRTDDPVRMYLREMGSVELLSREGEIAIAKRIEAGRELMIGALCESPLTFEALTVWRDELNEGKVLLRDIIDLEAMYGAGPDGQPAMCRRRSARRPAAAIRGAGRCAAGAQRRWNSRSRRPRRHPRPSRPNRKAEGEAGAEGGEGAAPADDGDDFDDEGNLPLVGDGSRAEAAGAGLAGLDRQSLQEAGQAAGRVGGSRAGQPTNCPPARNAASRSCATRPWTWSSRSS